MSWLYNGRRAEEPPVLLGLLPDPIRKPLIEDFRRRTNAGHWSWLDPSRAAFEEWANPKDYYTKLGHARREGELPDLLVTKGISSLFYLDFRSRFVDHGVFADVTAGRVHPRYQELGLADPEGRYTILCINPIVIVADHSKMLPEDPLPRSWADLLRPEYRRKVSIRCDDDTYCMTTLLTLRHVYGLEAVGVLGESVGQGQHSSCMAGWAGKGHPDASPYLVMPYYHAKSIQNQEQISIVWPEEGAIVNPVFMLTKASVSARLRALTDYFAGPYASAIYEKAMFPSVHPDVESHLPDKTPFLWMGWDMLWNEDIQQVTRDVHGRFLESHRKVTY